MEKITLCGDDCFECPRYLEKTDDELKKVAELWFRVSDVRGFIFLQGKKPKERIKIAR